MVRAYYAQLILSVFLCLPQTAMATGEDDACPTGQLRNIGTEGHCCWDGQNWDSDLHQCVGLAECPPGFLPSLDGTDCAEEKCQDGQVATGEGCCWPGQEWNANQDGEGTCTGSPQCPSGWQSTGLSCGKLTPLPPAALRPYQGVAPGDYIRVNAGDYLRGSPRSEPGRFKNERQHSTFLTRPFFLKRTEVTQDEWSQLVPHNPARFRGCGDECPVERVSWYEALAWLNRLSEKEGLTACYELRGCTGALGGGCRLGDGNPLHCAGDYVCSVVKWKGLDCTGYRLPTEAEWEYAARAGSLKATHMGMTAETARLKEAAWYGSNSGVIYRDGVKCSEWTQSQNTEALCGAHPSGLKVASPWGHHDLHGNVMEWVWDAFHRYPKRSVVDPVRHLGVDRVVRGGSWASDAKGLRVAQRGRLAPGARNAMLGFRPARTILNTEESSATPSDPRSNDSALDETSETPPDLGEAKPLPSNLQQAQPVNPNEGSDFLVETRPPRPKPLKGSEPDLEFQDGSAPPAGARIIPEALNVDSDAPPNEVPGGTRIRVEKVSEKLIKQPAQKKKQRRKRDRKAVEESSAPRRMIPLKVVPTE